MKMDAEPAPLDEEAILDHCIQWAGTPITEPGNHGHLIRSKSAASRVFFLAAFPLSTLRLKPEKKEKESSNKKKKRTREEKGTSVEAIFAAVAAVHEFKRLYIIL